MTDTLDALRSLAPTLPIDPAALEDAHARLARAAFDGEDSPTGAVTQPATGGDDLARRRTRRRAAASIALAASAVTGVIVVTQLVLPTSSAMAWSRTGTEITGERAQELAAECAAGWTADDPSLAEVAAESGVSAPSAADLAAPVLVLAEERGETSLVVAEVGGWTAFCASGQAGGTRVLAPAAGEAFAAEAASDAEAAFINGSAAVVGDLAADPEDARYVTFGNVMGVAAPGVTGVTLTLPDGTTLEATVGGERFLAWWPGEEIAGTELGDDVGPEWDPREGVSITWTYADGTTGGPADL